MLVLLELSWRDRLCALHNKHIVVCMVSRNKDNRRRNPHAIFPAFSDPLGDVNVDPFGGVVALVHVIYPFRRLQRGYNQQHQSTVVRIRLQSSGPYHDRLPGMQAYNGRQQPAGSTS